MSDSTKLTNLRNTRQRQLVLRAVQARCDHPSADSIYLDIRRTDSKISRGTVYRNLNLLVQNGELMHVKVPGVDRFDSRLDLHCHLLCTVCGTVSDAPICYNPQLDRAMEEASGFQISRHRTVFEGVCAACREESPGDPQA